MRWFVEVSRVGDDAGSKKYCVEAKQWQAALQEARKLRGDAGPLSKFSIELMDNGYRAVDPASRVRYVVNKAPADAPLTALNGSAPASESAPHTEVMSSRPSAAPATTAEPSKPKPSIKVPDDAVPPPPTPAKPAPVDPVTPPPGASKHPTQRSMEAPRPPAFQLVRTREEEPKPDTPITYREYAYAVEPGTTLQAAEVLLWARFREVQSALAGRAPGKFVQLAVFDHVFERRPARPPLATLAWKDWRGEPVLQKFDGAAAPAPASKPAPAPAAATESKPAPAPVEPAPAPAAKASKPAPAPAAKASKPAPAPAAKASKPAPAPAAKASKPAPAPAAKASKPAPAAKPHHRRGEDLIGELFETMHDLHFMPDLMAGADFVLGVLKQTLPCEAAMVHIFDINTNQFVVVRAAVPEVAKVLLQRTPDRDAYADKVMRRMRSQRFDSAASEPGLNEGRWAGAGVKVHSALAAPVHLGGRYLGMIELVNPEGGGPFLDPEANALDYICEQFAEFLAARPIVLDADVVMAEH